MPRQPALRKKKVGRSASWFTKAGGDTYFGNVEEVSYQDAQKLFADHLLKIRTQEAPSKRRTTQDNLSSSVSQIWFFQLGKAVPGRAPLPC